MQIEGGDSLRIVFILEIIIFPVFDVLWIVLIVWVFDFLLFVSFFSQSFVGSLVFHASHLEQSLAATSSLPRRLHRQLDGYSYSVVPAGLIVLDS